MNQVVTDYAFKNRYQLNGEKSAVMVFNATSNSRGRWQPSHGSSLGKLLK